MIKIAQDNNLRLSYQTAYRFPGTQSKYIRLDVGDYTLLGGLPWIMDYMHTEKNPVFELGENNVPATTPYQYHELKPESVRSFEAGYKGLIAKKLLIDVYGYLGKYQDFIGRNALYRSYHRGTHFTLNISDAESFHLPKLPTGAEFHFAEAPYCYRCPHGKVPDSCNLECTKVIEELMKKEKEIGSFYIEPVMGSGGVIIPPRKYLDRIQALCKQYNIFLIVDEVLTGFGRLGCITASELFSLEPDAISFAKGMSAGYTAIGAAVMNEELSSGMKKYEDVSATFAWTPLACCIAEANIKLIIKEKLDEQALINGKWLLQETSILFHKYLPSHCGEVKGLGSMIGIELVEDLRTKKPDKKLTQKFIIAALRQGLMVCASWDFQAIILMPPLNVTKKEMNDGLNKMEDILKWIS